MSGSPAGLAFAVSGAFGEGCGGSPTSQIRTKLHSSLARAYEYHSNWAGAEVAMAVRVAAAQAADLTAAKPAQSKLPLLEVCAVLRALAGAGGLDPMAGSCADLQSFEPLLPHLATKAAHVLDWGGAAAFTFFSLRLGETSRYRASTPKGPTAFGSRHGQASSTSSGI